MLYVYCIGQTRIQRSSCRLVESKQIKNLIHGILISRRATNSFLQDCNLVCTNRTQYVIVPSTEKTLIFAISTWVSGISKNSRLLLGSTKVVLGLLAELQVWHLVSNFNCLTLREDCQLCNPTKEYWPQLSTLEISLLFSNLHYSAIG